MVALLKTLASRLSLLVLLSTVLGIMATPLPIYETASQLERRYNHVELYLRKGYFLASGKFSISPGKAQTGKTVGYLMCFGAHKGSKVTRIDTVGTSPGTSPTSPKWKLERVPYSNQNKGIFLGTLIFAKREIRQEVLGESNSDGEFFNQIFEGENAAEVFNQVLEWLQKDSRITYEANPGVWKETYEEMKTSQ
ncbi:hypothetical protein F5879DRAFT_922796 [Lentinula edodes]|nr:hypothetical protein F5879DRAFT_922796 [Lentinula edodes]KAJ3914487.1 hypothetical protein F5877DRAFT_70686 [Lentinula edodes]